MTRKVDFKKILMDPRNDHIISEVSALAFEMPSIKLEYYDDCVTLNFDPSSLYCGGYYYNPSISGYSKNIMRYLKSHGIDAVEGNQFECNIRSEVTVYFY